MSLTEKISSAVQILTLIAATYIGVIQTQINERQASLSDFVAIAASPDSSGSQITLLNTGRSNLYISQIVIGSETIKYDRPRLLATGTLDSSYYWVTPPSSLQTGKNFALTVYVTDEFGTEWVSDHEGRINENRTLNLWSYRMEKRGW